MNFCRHANSQWKKCWNNVFRKNSKKLSVYDLFLCSFKSCVNEADLFSCSWILIYEMLQQKEFAKKLYSYDLFNLYLIQYLCQDERKNIDAADLYDSCFDPCRNDEKTRRNLV